MKSKVGIAFVGCGYVFDIYMRTIEAYPEFEIHGFYDRNPERAKQVVDYYGLRAYASLDELLADARVTIVVNLTSIASHYSVSSQCLQAGKHVYSEKPLTTSLEESQDLFRIARDKGVRLHSAPCNIYSDLVRTIVGQVRSGVIGAPKLIYAELDDSPIHLMDFETVRSPSGAPWPLVDEIHEGCTFEHAGYHLVWICAILGPVVSVTAYSSELLPDKCTALPGYAGTPDFSVACLTFRNGESARLTCSVVAPRNHEMRIIGTKGEVTAESYRLFQGEVRTEVYTSRSLHGRKFRSVCSSNLLRRFFGIGGKRVPLLGHWKSDAFKTLPRKSSLKGRLVDLLRRNQVYAQDKLLGVAELAVDIESGRAPFLSDDFFLHINELTLLIQRGGSQGTCTIPKTSFEPLKDFPVGGLGR